MPLALRAERQTVFARTVAVPHDGIEAGTHTAPQLAHGVPRRRLNRSVDVRFGSNVGLGNENGDGILGVALSAQGRTGLNQVAVGKANFAGQDFLSIILIHDRILTFSIYSSFCSILTASLYLFIDTLPLVHGRHSSRSCASASTSSASRMTF